MISKETFRNLVLAGSNVVKAIIESNRLLIEYLDEYRYTEVAIPDEMLDYLQDEHLLAAFKQLVRIADDIGLGGILYADVISLFAFDDPHAERYLELMYEYLTTKTVPPEMREIEKQVTPDVCFWVRNNLAMY